MREWWDIDALTACTPILRGLAPGGTPAFRAVAGAGVRDVRPMLTSWRRLPYLDPGLPLEHLPRDWPGIEAGELFAGWTPGCAMTRTGTRTRSSTSNAHRARER